jgi:D-glycero-D-manno-heptose 1,7-bisphosphate phosphatase
LDKGLFLDRDGVVNVDHGYVHQSSKFEFIDGIFELGRKAQDSGYKIFIITNQAGIARGFYTEADFLTLTDWMCAVFLEERVNISKVYFSPYHPTAGIGVYLKDDYSRKPNPGMIIHARDEFNINLENSILIGDKYSDIEAGIAAGIGVNLLYSADYKNENQILKIDTLKDALKYLK